MFQEAGHVKNTFVFVAYSMFIFDVWRYPGYLMSTGIQVQPQIVLDPDCLLDYLSISYDYGIREKKLCANNSIATFFVFYFLSGFSFTNIHDSQDSRGRERVSL